MSICQWILQHMKSRERTDAPVNLPYPLAQRPARVRVPDDWKYERQPRPGEDMIRAEDVDFAAEHP